MALTPLFVPSPVVAFAADSWENGLSELDVYLPVRPYPRPLPGAEREDLARWTILPPNDRTRTLVDYAAEYGCPLFKVWLPEHARVVDFDPLATVRRRLLVYADNAARILPPSDRAVRVLSPELMIYGEHRFELQITESSITRLGQALGQSDGQVADKASWLAIWRMRPTDDPWVWAMRATVTAGRGVVLR